MEQNQEIISNSIEDTVQKNHTEEEENDEEKKKNKRRSKNEVQGRTYKCNMCLKCYLSYPALYTHCKQKHNTNNSSGRGRGRPKKESNIDNALDKINYNPINASYFQKEERKGTITDFDEPIRTAFNVLYSQSLENKARCEKRGMESYSDLKEHPFLIKYFNNNHDVKNKLTNENAPTDEVFMEYLNKMSVHTNENYFAKLITFVTLFREHVNLSCHDKHYSKTKQFTEINNAEDVPDLSNMFITDFLDPEVGDFNYTKEEAIDITLNLCHWMYENNFTCSKLAIINNEIK